MSAANAYQRSALSWIKRRARRIEKAFTVSRRTAIWTASFDYADFSGHSAPAGLRLVKGGHHG